MYLAYNVFCAFQMVIFCEKPKEKTQIEFDSLRLHAPTSGGEWSLLRPRSDLSKNIKTSHIAPLSKKVRGGGA